MSGNSDHRYVCDRIVTELGARDEWSVTEDTANTDGRITESPLIDTPAMFEVETTTVTKPVHIIQKVTPLFSEKNTAKSLVFGVKNVEAAERIENILLNPTLAKEIDDDGNKVLYNRRAGVKTRDAQRLYVPSKYDKFKWMQTGENQYRVTCFGFQTATITINFTLVDNELIPLSQKKLGLLSYNQSRKQYEVVHDGETSQYTERESNMVGAGETALEDEWTMLPAPFIPSSCIGDNRDTNTLNRVKFLVLDDEEVCLRNLSVLTPI